MARLPLAALLAGLAAFAAATDHIVGGNRGWNPNINYSLWSGNQTFFVGDLISFRYQKGMYNVFEVNETGYDNCTMAGVSGNWTSGKDFIPVGEPGKHYFICGNGFCQSGMKVAITVHPLTHNASSAHRGSTVATEKSAATVGRNSAWLALAVAVVASMVWV